MGGYGTTGPVRPLVWIGNRVDAGHQPKPLLCAGSYRYLGDGQRPDAGIIHPERRRHGVQRQF